MPGSTKRTYWQHYTEQHDEWDTLEDAMRAAWAGTEYNTDYTETIEHAGVTYNRDMMSSYWEQKGWD